MFFFHAYAVASPDVDFTVPDPAGDTFGSGGVLHDITSVSGSSDGTDFVLTVEFAEGISPPNGASSPAVAFAHGISAADGPPPAAVTGLVDFDTDQDSATGGRSLIDIFCADPSNMGVEASLSLAEYNSGTGTVPLGGIDVPVTFAASSFTITIPLSSLGGDDIFNFGMVVGTLIQPTDCAPDDGGFIDTSGFQVQPTATATPAGPTPTATETATAPTPTATVVAITLPETGYGPSGGRPLGRPLLPWGLVAVGGLALATASRWNLRRGHA